MTKSQSQSNSQHLKLSAASFGGPEHEHHHHHHHHEQDQSPPVSPLRLPQLSSSSSSISSWSSSQTSQLSGEFSQDGDQCNSKEDRSSYNTKFARYHLESYRQNDRIRWNFDFEHNRPLDDSHHQPSMARYQWEPAV